MFGWLAVVVVVRADILTTYLTWRGDTSRTMTVTYQADAAVTAPEVHFDTQSRGGNPTAYAHHAKGDVWQIPNLPVERWVAGVELLGLKPGATYYFVSGDPQNGYTSERKFKTLPLDEPIRFITGGDMSVGERTDKLLVVGAALEPHFCLIGGDIAYVNGDLTKFATWDRWFAAYESHMVSPDGYTIPMIVAIGNHETNKDTTNRFVHAPFYFGYFHQSAVSHFARGIGNDAVIFALDTGHVTPHGGIQAAWLDRALERYQDRKYTFAVYHVPLYPSHRQYDGGGSVAGRNAWLPIFDKHGLTAAFENHDHTYKRSKLLKGDREDPNGTLYLGDGCFGQGARDVDAELRWYLVKQASTVHIWRVDIGADGVVYRAYDVEGTLFDTYPE